MIVERTWESELLDSREDFVLSSDENGYRLSGTTLIPHEGIRVQIDYVVEAGPDWSTRSAVIDIPALSTAFQVEVTDESWIIDGDHRPDLDGCVDIDLGWTPATNTLPIRRLEFVTAIPRTIRAAWLRWPELLFIPTDQTYTRHRHDRWTYASGDFSAELWVDEHGVVIDYGDPPIWRAVSGPRWDRPHRVNASTAAPKSRPRHHRDRGYAADRHDHNAGDQRRRPQSVDCVPGRVSRFAGHRQPYVGRATNTEHRQGLARSACKGGALPAELRPRAGSVCGHVPGPRASIFVTMKFSKRVRCSQ